jgi:TonB family protein
MIDLIVAASIASFASSDQAAAEAVTPPRLRSGTFTDWDYPAAAVHASEEGWAEFRLNVAANGDVVDCRITVSSGSAALDAISCMIPLQRYRFAPGRNARRERVPSTFSQRSLWVLPSDQPVPARAPTLPTFASGEVQHVLASERQGVRCAIETTGLAFAAEAATSYCRRDGRDNFDDLARQPIAMMIVTTLDPEDEAPAPRRRIQGTLIAGAASHIEIASDGHVISCSDAPLPDQVQQPFTPLCQTRLRPGLAFQPNSDGRVRRGRYSIKLYRLGERQLSTRSTGFDRR